MTDELPRRRGRPPKSSYHASAPGYQMQGESDAKSDADLAGEPVETETAGNARPIPGIPADEGAPEAVERIDEASGPTAAAYEAGWSGMASAPSDGRPCVLAGLVSVGIPLSTPATMHHSRRWTGSVTRWVPFHEWRILNSPDRLPFEPLCWTRYE